MNIKLQYARLFLLTLFFIFHSTETADAPIFKDTTCKPGWFLNSTTGICDQCSFKCIECLSSKACSKCPIGYYLNKSGQCLQCSFGCMSCIKNEQICDKCFPRFYFINRGCQNCTANCEKCDNENVCLSCAKGYKKITGNSDVCYLASTDFNIVGLLFYTLISGLLIFFLVETVNRNQRLIFKQDGYLINYGTSNAASPQEKINWRETTNKNLGRLQGLQDRLSIV